MIPGHCKSPNQMMLSPLVYLLFQVFIGFQRLSAFFWGLFCITLLPPTNMQLSRKSGFLLSFWSNISEFWCHKTWVSLYQAVFCSSTECVVGMLWYLLEKKLGSYEHVWTWGCNIVVPDKLVNYQKSAETKRPNDECMWCACHVILFSFPQTCGNLKSGSSVRQR